MTPQTQLCKHDPGNGVYGDCQRAVIASLLDLQMSEVPHFLEVSRGDARVFWETLHTFCQSKGFAYITVTDPSSIYWYTNKLSQAQDVYHEISGLSPRGDFLHAVVGKSGEVFFDPHPSRAGLLGARSGWLYSFLVRL